MDKKSIKVGIIEIWTILAIVLHFCDVGYFAKWSVIDWPWHWSCCCLLIWEWIVVIVLLLVFSIIAKREKKRRYKHVIDKLEENGHYRAAESIKKAMDDGVLK